MAKIRDLNPYKCRVVGALDEYEYYIAFAKNAIKLSTTDSAQPFTYLQQDFIKQTLITSNVIGYDRIARRFMVAYGFGLNDYWKPTDVTFVVPNRAGYTRKISYDASDAGAYLITGLPSNISLGSIIRHYTDRLRAVDRAIIQNLGATKTANYIVVRDKDTRLSVLQAVQQTEDGEPVIVVDGAVGDGLRGIKNETPFLIPQLEEYKEQVRSELLTRLGTMSANTNKRERVQSAEVNASVGQCEDSIYTLIDNLNLQFKTYELPFKVELNNSLEELYYPDSSAGEEEAAEPEEAIKIEEQEKND